MKKPAYGLNDAPRRWWNIIDKAIRDAGGVPTRADRCCYLVHSKENRVSGQEKDRESPKTTNQQNPPSSSTTRSSSITTLEEAMDHLLDPVHGSVSKGKTVCGVICLHVDDLFMTGNSEFYERVIKYLYKQFTVGSEDKNDIEFVGQRIRWIQGKDGWHVQVDQNKCIDELQEVDFDKTLKDSMPLPPSLHTAFRSIVGQVNWLQSRTQFQVCYRFSRSASCCASPTIADLKVANKLIRSLKAEPVTLKFWPLSGDHLRICAYPDAAYRNNSDGSSQRGHAIFLAEPRGSTANSRGSLVEFESHKITRTTLSTTVSELYALMKCFGTCQMLRGLWADISGTEVPIHIRTDANNLVTTATSTHLPEQRETIHMIQMLRKESLSGAIEDLAHVRSHVCLGDALTKSSAKPDALKAAVDTGILVDVDMHPSVRTLIRHRAFLLEWSVLYLEGPLHNKCFLLEAL